MAKKSYRQKNQESLAKTGKTLYERRIASGKERGLSTSQSRGHPDKKKGEKPASVIKKEKEAQKRKPPSKKGGAKKEAGWSGQRYIETPYTRRLDKRHSQETTIRIPMTFKQFQQWQAYIDAGLEKTAKVYALAEVYEVEELAGLPWQEEGPDGQNYFEWYDDYENWEDIPEYDDDYVAGSGAAGAAHT